jgi:hypothetical protein
MRLSKKKTYKRYKKKLRGGVNTPPSHPTRFNRPSLFSRPLSHPALSHPALSHPTLFNRPSLFTQPIDPIMTTIPGLPEYTPMEIQDEEDILCQGLSDMKVKGKMVFIYIISHGGLLPIPQGGQSDYTAAKNMCAMVYGNSQDNPLNTNIFPDIKNNQNLLHAASNDRFNPMIFPFYLSDSKLRTTTHNMNLLALESGCINLINLDYILYISNLLSTSVGNEDLNKKVVFNELTKKLNEYNNSCVSKIAKSCIRGSKNPCCDYNKHKLLKSANKGYRIQSQNISSGMNCTFSTNAVKAVPNWPTSLRDDPKILQNNKIYTNLYNDITDEEKVKYDQIAGLVKNDITRNRVDYHRNPLIKLYFKTDRVGGVDGVDVFLNVPTHEFIALTDVLNRVSHILELYGMKNSEIVIVDNSCSDKDPYSFSYAGGKTKKNKKIYKKKRRTVRRPLRG